MAHGGLHPGAGGEVCPPLGAIPGDVLILGTLGAGCGAGACPVDAGANGATPGCRCVSPGGGPVVVYGEGMLPVGSGTPLPPGMGIPGCIPSEPGACPV